MTTKFLILTTAVASLAVVSCKKEDPKADFQPITKYTNSLPEFYLPVTNGQSYGQNNPDFTVIANAQDRVVNPNDLDFNTTPGFEKELWIINESTASIGGTNVIIQNAGEANQTELFRKDGNSWHFMSLPTAIAFSQENGHFGTSSGIYDANHNGGSPYAGPSLWDSDLAVFAQFAGPGTNGSHLDMLHESPYSMGMASEVDNKYWVFDGYAGEIVMYDFKADHGPGMHDHSDGEVARYTECTVTRKLSNPLNQTTGIPSHMIYDKRTGFLYVCDTGGKRIMRMDTKSGSVLRNLPLLYEPLASRVEVTGVTWEVFASTNLIDPCGIEISGNRLLVSDNGTNEIIAYDLNGKQELGRLQTPATNLRGIKIGPDKKLWYVDYGNNEVVRIDPK